MLFWAGLDMAMPVAVRGEPNMVMSGNCDMITLSNNQYYFQLIKISSKNVICKLPDVSEFSAIMKTCLSFKNHHSHSKQNQLYNKTTMVQILYHWNNTNKQSSVSYTVLYN